MSPDLVAARVHRAKASEHYDAAERFRKLGLDQARRDALDAARREDDLAEKLEERKR